MDFNQLLAKMAELDQPAVEAVATEAVLDECPGNMAPPMAPSAPSVPEPSMSLNLNAQGMDNIESLMKLMTKVNPDMINQPAAPTSAVTAMPSLTPPGPSISSIGDLGNLDKGPLKMLPDLDADNDNKPGGENDIDAKDLDSDDEKKEEVNESPADDAEIMDLIKKFDRQANEIGAYGDPDVNKVMQLIQAGKIEDAADEIAGAYSDQDGGEVWEIEGMYADLVDELKAITQKEPTEEWANSLGDSKPEIKDVDYMNNKLAGGMNRPKGTHPKVAGGDNPMQKPRMDTRESIRTELLQRLAEAKGAK